MVQKGVHDYKQIYYIVAASWNNKKHLKLDIVSMTLPYSKPEDIN